MTTRILILLLLILLLFPGAVAYAEPPAEVTADQAVALYRENSARLAASRAELAVTAAELLDAHAYPNPTLGLSNARTVGGTDTIGGSQYTLDVELPLLIGHQRSRRELAARAHIEATRRQIEVGAGATELGIRGLVSSLQASQERVAILGAAVEDARNLRTIVAGRSAAGASSAYAVERIDLAIAALSSKRDDAQTEVVTASAELARAVGIPGWHPRAQGTLAPAPPIEGPVDPGHPQLAIDHQAEAVAHADEVRARADAVPTPSIGLQAFATTDPSGVAVSFGASIPLPMFDRNQGAIARARAEAKRAVLELAADHAELTADLERARSQLVARQTTLARFQAEALQRLPKLREMAEASYRSGQGGIVELLDALDAITEAKLREIELRAAVVEAELAIRNAAKGR